MLPREQLIQRQRLHEEIDLVPNFAVGMILLFAHLINLLVKLVMVLKKAADTGIDLKSVEPSISAAELAGDLAGCLDDGPLDLSTNPTYMEGFGS
ncbi:MAG: hypothetical protein AAF579_13905 [Cyanobacteria bacterium P01_C01_bin.118]